MANTRPNDQSKLGAAVLGRIAEVGAPKALKPFVTAFTPKQRALEAASKRCEEARAVRDRFLEQVGDGDMALDRTLDVLANRMIGNDMGTRKNAFAGYSSHAPGALADLPYASEVREVGKLVSAVRRAKPAANVVKAAADCAAAAAACTAAIKALTKPQAEYSAALAARDALLTDWTRAFRRVRANAKAAWIDSPETYKLVFAPADAVTATAKPHKPKSVVAPQPVAPSPSNGG